MSPYPSDPLSPTTHGMTCQTQGHCFHDVTVEGIPVKVCCICAPIPGVTIVHTN
jgi:hypothetical protein